VFFLQNHDQTGNRAFGERLISLCGPDLALLRAVTALQILSPHIPMLFMGEECGSTAPFQYFTSFREPSIAQAVRDGRRSEFAAFNAFSELAEKPGILDPNELKTWENCQISADADSKWAADWRDWYRSLLYLRREFITPHLPGARSDSVCIMAPLCVAARWRLGNNSLLSIYCNFSGQDVYPPAGTFDKSEFLIFDSATSADDAYTGDLPIGGTHATGAMRTDHLRAASTRAGMTPGAWPEVDK
jgi:maltooligosyltrehalose trehalohydrolase